jgi:hypothetical protein
MLKLASAVDAVILLITTCAAQGPAPACGVALRTPSISYSADSIPLGPARPGVVRTHPDPARCNDYVSKALTVISDLPPAAQGHHWVVVCSLDTWNYALQNAGAWGRTNTAFTNEKTKTTFINGAVFEEPEQFYRQTVYHEAGHVICSCNDEQRASGSATAICLSCQRFRFTSLVQ